MNGKLKRENEFLIENGDTRGVSLLFAPHEPERVDIGNKCILST